MTKILHCKICLYDATKMLHTFCAEKDDHEWRHTSLANWRRGVRQPKESSAPSSFSSFAWQGTDEQDSEDMANHEQKREKRPYELAEMCLRELVGRSTSSKIANIIRPLLKWVLFPKVSCRKELAHWLSRNSVVYENEAEIEFQGGFIDQRPLSLFAFYDAYGRIACVIFCPKGAHCISVYPLIHYRWISNWFHIHSFVYLCLRVCFIVYFFSVILIWTSCGSIMNSQCRRLKSSCILSE